MAKIELKSVNELLGMKFFIPSYQRGYRWTEQQVRDLLNDVNEFEPQEFPDSKEKSWYCLQPLVVKKNDDVFFEVIDGQQRLTTIWIIINLLDNQSLTLEYKTRHKSGDFIKNIANKEDESNIDFFFMSRAKKEIEKWKMDKSDTRPLINKLKHSCKVIWYETEENAYEVFKRLNSGKISLSNAELVKALLMKDDNFNKMNIDALRLKQLEMAGEWDRMEQILHDNSFWYFINPVPEHSRFNCTRIDFLLEMILRCENFDVDNELKLNDYFIFSKYAKKIIEEGWEKQWYNIQKYFRIMKSWYDNRQLYHYVGYLMNRKGENKMSVLCDLLRDSNKPKDEFLSDLIIRCQKTIGLTDKIQEVIFADLEYSKNNDKSMIHNILLLFNLATVQNQTSEVSRYPFKKHYEASKKKWSLEHIHAQNEVKASWNEEQFSKIKGYLKNVELKDIDKLNKYLEDKKTSENIDGNTYKAIMGAFMGERINVQKNDDNTISFSSNFEKDDSLTNLALLQGDKNAAFNNKLYPEKREKLAEYENVETETLFVPICTRNVFFKHYSPNSPNPLLWDKKAGEEYVTAITKVVAAYLRLDAVLQTEDQCLKYGVKKKGGQK